jgi:hypothetical protein
MLLFHVPKTGGTWATAALTAAGVPIEPIRHPKGHGHAVLRLAGDIETATAALATERTAHQRTTEDLERLRNSRLIRTTRPLRRAYYRMRSRPTRRP